MSHRIVQGFAARFTITVKEDGTAKNISTATTVTVYLIASDDSNNGVIRLSTVASSGETGADFTNGVIVVNFTGVQTATLTVNERLWLTVSVDTDDIWIKPDFDAHGQSIPVYADPTA